MYGRTWLVAVALGGGIGCDLVGEGQDCTTEARASVTVQVTDGDGAAIDDATVTFAVDGGDELPCDAMSGGQYVCGWEAAGDFVVRVEAQGYEPWEGEATVEADACHVIGEQLVAELVPVACDESLRASIVATVVGSSGEALSDVVVTYAPEGGDDDRPCEPQADDQWVCGWEEAGAFVVTAGAAGHVSESRTVEVEADVCHVITEYVDFALEWAPD